MKNGASTEPTAASSAYGRAITIRARSVRREHRGGHHERVEGLDGAVGGLQVVDPPERGDQPREEAGAPVLAPRAAPACRSRRSPARSARTRSRPRTATASDASTPATRTGSPRRGTRQLTATAASRRSLRAIGAACTSTAVTTRSRCGRACARCGRPSARRALRIARRRGRRSRSRASRRKILAGKSSGVCVLVTKRYATTSDSTTAAASRASVPRFVLRAVAAIEPERPQGEVAARGARRAASR